MTDLDERIIMLAELIVQSKRLVVFTGAGISTESGVPDFRGPNGVWTRQEKGLPPPAKVDWTQIQPNQGHVAIVNPMPILISNYNAISIPEDTC